MGFASPFVLGCGGEKFEAPRQVRKIRSPAAQSFLSECIVRPGCEPIGPTLTAAALADMKFERLRFTQLEGMGGGVIASLSMGDDGDSGDSGRQVYSGEVASSDGLTAS